MSRIWQPFLFIVLAIAASAPLAYAQDPFAIDRVISQKTHAGNGYDVPLPLSGASGVECRRGAIVGEHTIIFVFSDVITSADAAVTSGVATIGNSYVFQDVLFVQLTGVANAQSVTLTVSNATDSFGQTLPPTPVTIRFLLGDTNGDGTVNAGDALQTRTRSGQDTSITNFRSDVNSDGTVNTGDAFVVRSRSGDSTN